LATWHVYTGDNALECGKCQRPEYKQEEQDTVPHIQDSEDVICICSGPNSSHV